MRQRCLNTRCRDYRHYGGRGITVCPRWDIYSNFLLDMGEAPQGKTLERIENSEGYTPGNCRWATRAEQSRNKRSNLLIKFDGQTKLLVEWAEHFNVPAGRIRSMMERHSPADIFERILKGTWP